MLMFGFSPEYMIQLPRNPTFDERGSPDILKRVRKFAAIHESLCFAERSTAEDQRAKLLSVPSDASNPYADERVAKAGDARDHARFALQSVENEVDALSRMKAAKFVELVESRALLEPIQGKCDAVLIDRLDLGEGNKVAEKFERYIEPTELGLDPADVIPESNDFVHGQGFFGDFKTWLKENPEQSSEEGSTHRLGDSFPHSHSPTGLWSVIGQSRGTPTVDTTPTICDPLLPVMVVEHKRAGDETVAKAVNQGYISMCSAVEHRESMGISPDRPVFSLITDGQFGSLNVACKSKASGVSVVSSVCDIDLIVPAVQITYIMERGVCTFDIMQPLQAFQFATFLIRLRARVNEERAEIQKEVIEHFEQTPARSLRMWTKTAQALQTPAVHNPVLAGHTQAIE